MQIKGLQSNNWDENSKNEFVDRKEKIKSQNVQENMLDTVYRTEQPYQFCVSALVQIEEETLVFNTNLELDIQIEKMVEMSEGLWNCNVCGKTYLNIGHAETHIEGIVLTCHICNKTLSNRGSLRVHINNSHILRDSTIS